MARRRRLPDLADDQRCTRNGTNWRCHLPRLPGKSYCQKHQMFNLARSQSKSKTKSNPSLLPDSQSEPQTQIQIQSQIPIPFKLREIWAFQDPHLYGRVERFIPAKSAVEITPLVSHPDSSPDTACGLFRPTDATEIRDMSSFSHRVWFEMEGADETYKIVPRKGEIWVVRSYGWVEMVDSFSGAHGASGAVLIEDEGSPGSFRRRLHDGCELIRRFLPEELWMFLNRVAKPYQLEGCTVAIEGSQETAKRKYQRRTPTEGKIKVRRKKQETICFQTEVSGTMTLVENNTEPGIFSIGNGVNIAFDGNAEENAQAVEAFSIGIGGSHESHQPISIGIGGESHQPLSVGIDGSHESHQPLSVGIDGSHESHQPLSVGIDGSDESRQAISVGIDGSNESHQPVSIEMGGSRESHEPVSIEMGGSRESHEPISIEMGGSRESHEPVSIGVGGSHELHEPVSIGIGSSHESNQKVEEAPANNY